MTSTLVTQAFQAAGDAIEAMVENHHPDDADNWDDIEPMDDTKGWGLTLARWAAEASEIVEAFNAAMSPKSVDLTATVIQNAGSKPLDQFQTYLASKVEMEHEQEDFADE